MKNKIIVLSGKQLSGKDCVARLLLMHLPDFKRIGLGDAIKQEYMERTGISREEIEKNKANYRADLIALGNKRRNEDKDYWIKKVINTPQNIIVPDMRMLRELEMFQKANAFTIRVTASLEARRARGTLASINDRTETELDNVSDWGYIIENNGTQQDLQVAVKTLFDFLCKNYL